MRRTIKDAIDMSKSFFLNNVTLSRLFNDHHVWYSARVKHSNGQGWSDCLVIPYGNGAECGIMFPTNKDYPTHSFSYRHQQKEGWMRVKVKETKDTIDPFYFRYSKFQSAVICFGIHIKSHTIQLL